MMSPRTFTPEATAASIRLADAAHIAWTVAQLDCADALMTWFEACPGQRDEAHLAYRAALDREEAAARDLQRLSTLAAEAA